MQKRETAQLALPTFNPTQIAILWHFDVIKIDLTGHQYEEATRNLIQHGAFLTLMLNQNFKFLFGQTFSHLTRLLDRQEHWSTD